VSLTIPTRGWGDGTWGTGTWDGIGTVVSLGSTWGNNAWGDGGWGDNGNVSVAGTGAVGSVVISLSKNIVPTGVTGTGAIGTAVIVQVQ
jgi:hypothetical protein